MSQRGIYERTPGDWYIRYADATGKIRREKAGTYAAATKLYHKRKQQVLEGKKLPENLRKTAVSFDEILDDALEFSKAHSSRRHYYGETLKKPLFVEWFGGRAAESIRPQEIERRLNVLAEGRQPATVNRYRSFLSRIFSLAVRNGRLVLSPVRETKRRKENNGRVRFLDDTEEEILRERIRSICPEREAEFDLALHTGMRQSELYSLRWEDVDLERSIITIRRSKHGEKRHIQMNSVARRALESLNERRDQHGRVVPLMREPVRGTNGERKRYYPRWFSERIVDGSGVNDFNWHDLRHTFASRLVMAGVPLRSVQELMGHKTIQMTLRYSHLTPSHLHEAVERLTQRKAKVAVIEKVA